MPNRLYIEGRWQPATDGATLPVINGLVATVVTGDHERAERLAAALEIAYVWVNSAQIVFVQTSWGGFKRSGIGRELGPWNLQAFLEIKHVVRPARA